MDRFAVAGDAYIKNRNGVFYLEIRVPTKLVDEVGKTHIRQSLKTTNASEAKRPRNSRLAEIEKEFREAEQRIAIKAGSRNRIDNLSEGQLEQVVADWLQQQQTESQGSYELYLSGNLPDDTDFSSSQQVVKECKEFLALLEASSSPMRNEAIANMALKCATDQHLSLNYRYSTQTMRTVPEVDAERDAKPYRSFLELVRKAWCELLRHRIALWSGERHKPEYVEVQSLEGQQQRKTKLTLSRLIELFDADPKRGKAYRSVKRQYKYDFIFRAMKETWGEDKDVRTIDRADCRDVRELLLKLPSNATKKFPGLNLKQIAEKMNSLAAAERPALFDPATVNSHLANMSTFLQFAANEQFIVANPAKSLGIETQRHSREDRSPFSEHELGQIFASRLFSKSGAPKARAFPVRVSMEASRYWVCVIALYHGMRANEICQLRISDLHIETGVNYFNLSNEADGQRLKTPSSKREVPFHPVLEKLGFKLTLPPQLNPD